MQPWTSFLLSGGTHDAPPISTVILEVLNIIKVREIVKQKYKKIVNVL